MHIQYVEIGNFRKLRAVRIDFAEATTLFVGANNSGKTSAMVALRRFLVDRAHFSVNDLTLAHWSELDAAALAWEKQTEGAEKEKFDWGAVLPHLDVWLNVPMLRFLKSSHVPNIYRAALTSIRTKASRVSNLIVSWSSWMTLRPEDSCSGMKTCSAERLRGARPWMAPSACSM